VRLIVGVGVGVDVAVDAAVRVVIVERDVGDACVVDSAVGEGAAAELLETPW
jgi:hypothetical protein